MKRKLTSGFTLIEMMLSISIMATLAGILYINYPDTAIRYTINNISNQLIDYVREIQIRGSSVDSLGGKVAGYGLHFASSSKDRFIYFADGVTTTKRNGIYIGNQIYDGVQEDKKIVILPDGFSIQKFCVRVSGVTTCTDDAVSPLASTTIVYDRPEILPTILKDNDVTQKADQFCVQVVSKFYFQGKTTHTRYVKVYNSGVTDSRTGTCP